VEGQRQAVEVGLQVDLGGKPAARAAEGLALLPPLWNGPPLSSTMSG
jgi:hypothetical protein